MIPFNEYMECFNFSHFFNVSRKKGEMRYYKKLDTHVRTIVKMSML